MARVRKGNVILTVDDRLVGDYKARGYDVISKGGAVIQKAVPADVAALQKAFTDQRAEIARLQKALEAKGADSDYKQMYEELERGHNQLLEANDKLEEEADALREEVTKLKAQIEASKSAPKSTAKKSTK